MFFVLSVNVSERFFAATPGVSFEDDDEDDDDESEDEDEDESEPKENPSRRGRVNAAALETT
jgi:hypothetical protein